MSSYLHWSDYVAVLGYFGVVIGIGIWVYKLFLKIFQYINSMKIYF